MIDYRELENRLAQNRDIRRERDNDRLVALALGKRRSPHTWLNRLKRVFITLVQGRSNRSAGVIPSEAVMTPQPQK